MWKQIYTGASVGVRQQRYFGTKEESVRAVVATLREANPQAVDLSAQDQNYNPHLMYRIAGISVCRVFFMAAWNLSNDKLKFIKEQTLGRTTVRTRETPYSPCQLVPDRTVPTQYSVAVSFWQDFFAQNCQIPREGLRLFPVNMPMRLIYEMYFVPWCRETAPVSQPSSDMEDKKHEREVGKTVVRQLMEILAEPGDNFYQEDLDSPDEEEIETDVRHVDAPPGLPSLSTMIRARWDKAFHDVVCRPKHHHARCPTCAHLQQQGLNLWKNQMKLDEHIELIRKHRLECTAWRQFEEIIGRKVSSERNTLLVF
jgi:hypothetical protein